MVNHSAEEGLDPAANRFGSDQARFTAFLDVQ